MKKFIILPLVAILLCGCSPKSSTNPILNNISFVADVDYRNQKYVCDVTIEDYIYVSILEPYQVEGLSLKIDNDHSIVINFKGISQTVDIYTLPQGAFIYQFVNLLNDVSQKNINHSKENSTITGTIAGEKYLFTFSPSGLPIMVKFDNIDLSIKFNNVVIK